MGAAPCASAPGYGLAVHSSRYCFAVRLNAVYCERPLLAAKCLRWSTRTTMNAVKFFVPAIALLLGGACTSSLSKPAYAPACDISPLREDDYQRDSWCTIKFAALRCSTNSDKCLIQCELRGGAPMIGGGCFHICSPSPYTQEDVIKNGGDFSPPGALQCINNDAP